MIKCLPPWLWLDVHDLTAAAVQRGSSAQVSEFPSWLTYTVGAKNVLILFLPPSKTFWLGK